MSTAPTMTAAAAAGPIGQPRGVGKVIILSIVTLGIYGLYWHYKTWSEVRAYRGEGPNGIVGILLTLVIAGYFILPQNVGRMIREGGTGDSPVSGQTGWWILLPYAGIFVWIAKIQGALNKFWESKGAAPA